MLLWADVVALKSDGDAIDPFGFLFVQLVKILPMTRRIAREDLRADEKTIFAQIDFNGVLELTLQDEALERRAKVEK